MVTKVTPVTFQLSKEFPPGLMLAGMAVKETTTGEAGGAAPTVTITCLVTVSAVLVAVRV
jgi:hypothetical protein